MDLGELEVPEPPLFHQAESEEIDLFLDSTSDVKQEVTENAVSNPDAAPTEATTLIGAWSGTYTHRRGQQSGSLTSFSITEKGADGSFTGLGIDIDGAFTVEGTIEGGKVNFTKSYTATYSVWKYIGTLDTETGTIVGEWGPPEMEAEAAPAPAIENETQSNHPEENKKEDTGDAQPSTEQVPPCDIEITVEGPTPGEGETEEAKRHGDGDEDDDKASQVGSTHSAVKTDATEVFAEGGTFSLVRRPVDYFLYRPSDIEFQENRSKALWQMVRNAAKQWHRSRHLIWDVLRERRDQRNRYVELFLKQEDAGRLYDSDEAAEWAKIIRQTHPNDLRLWRAIVRYKQHRTPKHLYVRIITSWLSLQTGSYADCLGRSYATIAGRTLKGAACCVATVLKEGGPRAWTSVQIAGHRRVHGSEITSIIYRHTIWSNCGALRLHQNIMTTSSSLKGSSIRRRNSSLQAMNSHARFARKSSLRRHIGAVRYVLVSGTCLKTRPKL